MTLAGMPASRTTRFGVLAIAGLVLIVGACGDSDDENASADTATAAAHECKADGTVDAPSDSEAVFTMTEWSIRPPTESLKAGNVRVVADNVGGAAHELVIIRADSLDDLTVVDGKVDEDALPTGAFIGEIEEFPAGSKCDATFALSAGTYILLCNIAGKNTDGTALSHFENGMSAIVTVE
jgi:hypothetical protein